MMKVLNYFILVGIFLYASYEWFYRIGFINYTVQIDERYCLKMNRDWKNDIQIASIIDKRNPDQVLIGPSIEVLNSNEDLIIGLVIKNKNDELFRQNKDAGFFIFDKHKETIVIGLSYNELFEGLKNYNIKESQVVLIYPEAAYEGTLP